MIDTDFILLPISVSALNGSGSFTRHDPYLLSAPVSPQTLDRLGCMGVLSALHPLTRGLPVPESFRPVP